MSCVLKLGSGELDCRSGKWLDKSGQHNHGTPVGGARPYLIHPSGVMGYNCDIGKYVEIIHNSSVDITTNFSFSIWFYQFVLWSNMDTLYPGVAQKSGATNSWYLRGMKNDNKIRFYIQEFGGALKSINSLSATTILKWYFLQLTYNGTVQKAYLNNVLQGTNTWTGTIKSIPNNIQIGTGNSASNNLLVAEPCLSNHVPSDRERTDTYYNSPIYKMQRGIL